MPVEPLTLLALHLLLAGDGAATRSLAGAGVGVRALSTNRQVTAVTNPTIRLNFDQAADVHLDLFAEVAFDAAFLLNDGTDTVDLIFRKVADLLAEIHIRLFGDILRAHLSNPVDRGQPDPKALLRRKINTSDTCHGFSLLPLSLPLLVLRIDANHSNHATAVDHLALVTNLFHACPHFHTACSSPKKS